MVARTGAMLVEKAAHIIRPHDAALARRLPEQRVMRQLAQLAAEPALERHAEPHLFPVQNFARQIGRHRRLEQRLCRAALHLDLGRDARRPFQQHMVEQGRAGFEPMRHAGDIDLHHQIVR